VHLPTTLAFGQERVNVALGEQLLADFLAGTAFEKDVIGNDDGCAGVDS
jgi:hypothetical protein